MDGALSHETSTEKKPMVYVYVQGGMSGPDLH